MNEIIKKLAIQAEADPDQIMANIFCFSYEKCANLAKEWNFLDDVRHDICELISENQEKFAELIVKECVRIMFEHGKTYAHPTAGEHQASVFSGVIKEHFGINDD